MKKSLFTFGLLASSLVMLAVVPFLNQNNSLLNTAMAQEYDKYEDSYYSQYPTDDKKYECRTGPLEGFFVSSVEFCKHIKFDDRKDHNRDNNNQTGTQGPPGPAGPFYKINGTESNIQGTELGLSVVQCDTGDIAISGSADYEISGGASISQIIDTPSESSNSTWIAEMRLQSTPGADGIVQAFAICLDNLPAHIP
jgi:hypothetical protein